MRFRFKDGNRVFYGQDFGFYYGVPGGVWFTVKKETADFYELTAPNYGGQPYGNGSLYVYKRRLKRAAS